MKFKKIAAVCAAAAAIAAMSVSVSAADWSQASYADNDPNTVKIVNADANGITFQNTVVNTDICKARITLDKILKNPEDYSKIRKMTWTVTYKGITPDFVSDVGLSGGTWATNTNAKGYTLRPEYDANDKAIWDKTEYTMEDYAEWGVGDAPACPEKDGEMVFMDWSYADIAKQGVTVTISNYKIYDADGNEIPQLGYGEYVLAAEGAAEGTVTEADTDADEADDEVVTEADVEETVPEETVPEETVPEEPEHRPGDDNMLEDSAKTGNPGILVAIAGIGISSAVLKLTGKKKDE